MTDDMGYADPGYMGSEISTPNLDALAAAGIIMTDFHVTTVCNTSRAQLLSGADHNLSTVGSRTQSRLSDDALPISQILMDAGYSTFFSGKWDVGREPESYPPTKGFSESFALLVGGASHFSDNTRIMAPDPEPGVYVENGVRLEALPEDFYSSTHYTNRIISYIDRYRDSGQPFFAYLAPTAPHWPLQAPDEYIARYEGRYDAGYEAIRQARYRRLRELGLNTHDNPLPPMLDIFPAWEDLTPLQQRLEARRMEIYAAMLEKFDEEIGRLIAYLEGIGEHDNTFIVFLSDNGAEGFSSYDFPGNPELLESLYDLSFANMGRRPVLRECRARLGAGADAHTQPVGNTFPPRAARVRPRLSSIRASSSLAPQRAHSRTCAISPRRSSTWPDCRPRKASTKAARSCPSRVFRCCRI